jgi:signal transduction histidine kinase
MRRRVVCAVMAGLPLSSNACDLAIFEYAVVTASAVLIALSVVLAALYRRNKRRQADIDKHYADVTHAARLALIGEITGAVVHEVTQPLSAILSNVEAAELLLQRPEPNLALIREILSDVRRDDLRAHNVVRRLRVMLRKRELQYENVDINALVTEALTLITADAGRHNIVIRAILDPGLPAVPADPVHLQQVLLNLIVNGMEAMKETPAAERRLDVLTERLHDQFVEISVIDRGQGIAPEHTEHVFNSFFTTKPEGMGLGLSIARSIVEMHGGAIWAENRESGGSAFRFTVPFAAHGAHAPPSAPPERQSANSG